MIQKQSVLNEQLAFLWGLAYQEAVFFPLYTFLNNYVTNSPAEPYSKSSSQTQLNHLQQQQQLAASSSSSLSSISSSPTASTSSSSSSKSVTTLKSSLVKAFRKALFLDGMQSNTGTTIRLNAEITVLVSEACKLYYNICTSFSLCKLDFLTGICFKQSSKLLIALWQFLKLTGVGVKESAVKAWAELLLNNTEPVQEHLMVLSTDAMNHYIT